MSNRRIQRGPRGAAGAVAVPLQPQEAMYITQSPATATKGVTSIEESTFSPGDLTELRRLRYTSKEPILDPVELDEEVTYYIANLISKDGSVNTLEYLKNHQFKDRFELLTDDAAYNISKVAMELELETYYVPFEVEAGMYVCPRCKSNKTISLNKQTRSADEGETIRVTCTECSFAWRQNS